ncbi:MAG: outer membrane beta-barrel protein [Chakrabartia sp.]
MGNKDIVPKLGGGLAFVLALGLADPAWAQLGPPRDTRKMEITAEANVLYDTNILRRADDAPDNPNVHPADLVVEPRLTLDLVAPFGRQSVFAKGLLGYRFHAEHGFLDRETANVTGGVRLRPIRPCTATGALTYVRQQSNLADILDTLDPKNTEQIATGSADLACATAGGLATRLGYRRTSATNSALIRQENEYESHSYSGSLGIARPRLGALMAYGSYGETRYPNRRPLEAGPAGLEDGMTFWSTGLRYERQIGTRLTGSVSGGYMKVRPKLPGVDGFKGANWSAQLSYDSRNRIKAALLASREVEASNLIGATYGVVTRYGASVDYALSPRFVLTTGASLAKRRYAQSPYYQLPSFNSRDRTISVYASLSAGNVGPVAIVVDAVREHRTAAVPMFNYGSTRFGVTATYRFGH